MRRRIRCGTQYKNWKSTTSLGWNSLSNSICTYLLDIIQWINSFSIRNELISLIKNCGGFHTCVNSTWKIKHAREMGERDIFYSICHHCSSWLIMWKLIFLIKLRAEIKHARNLLPLVEGQDAAPDLSLLRYRLPSSSTTLYRISGDSLYLFKNIFLIQA